MGEDSGETKSRLLVITSFYPDFEGIRRGPWGERFLGLYGRIFKNHVCDVCWYSLAEHSFAEKSLGGDSVLRKHIGVFSFLLKELVRLFRFRIKSLILFHYPIFRAYDIVKSGFFISALFVMRRLLKTKVYLDFVEPPLLMPEVRKYTGFSSNAKFRIMRVLEKCYLSNSDVIITGGDEMSDHLRNEYELSSKSFITIEQGIHIEEFSVHNKRWEKVDFTVLYAGTLSKDRGILDLFECIRKVNKRFPVNLLCCGKVQQSLEIPEDEWLKIYTNLSYYDFVEMIIRRADVAILPYPVNDWWQKISISKLATYLAAGLPVISTDLTQTAAFLRLWDCGRVSNNWSEIEKMICELFQDRELCRKLGENARKAAERNLNWPFLAKRLENSISFYLQTAVPYKRYGENRQFFQSD
jgi:glycosyltransferase involved in cell wall biosynthesis